MRRWRVVIGLVLLNVALLWLGAAVRRVAAPVSGKRVRIGVVADVGGLGDKSFNDAAYAGLMQAAAELDIETRFVEPGDGSDRESALRQLADGGFDLVIGVGFVFTDDIRAAAARFPAVKFACVDYSIIPGQSPPPANLVALRFREHEGSYLAGALAALVSKSKLIGFVGGMDIPLIHKFQAGYTAGVAKVCPDCRVLAAYAGTSPKAFADPTTGKELALSQYDKGVEVIFAAAGKTGIGVFNAARDREKLAIGVDINQFREAPCCILTSMVKQVQLSVFETIRAVVEGKFEGGIRERGLKENGVDYVYDDHNRQWISADVRAQVEALRREVIAGKIEVPFE